MCAKFCRDRANDGRDLGGGGPNPLPPPPPPPPRYSIAKKGLLLSKRRKCGEIAKGNFLKIAETAHRAPRSTEAAFSEHFNSYNSIRFQWRVMQPPRRIILALSAANSQPRRRGASVIFGNCLLRFHRIFLLFVSSKPLGF